MSWLPYLLVFLVLAIVQLSVRRALGPTKKVGDEGGYITCGAQPDPYQPGIFLRVPLMAWISSLCHRFSSNPERQLRRATGIASIVTILVSMISARMIGGDGAAILIGLILGFMPGRIILSNHIWPDIWLGLWLSLFCLVLVYPDLPPNLRALLLGLLAVLAFMTRFEALLLTPFTVFGMAPLALWEWVFILSPTLLVFIVLSIRNAHRYKIPWPDNTWMFNLMIAAGETGQQKASKVLVEQEVFKVLRVWRKLNDPGRFAASIDSLRRLFAWPVRAIAGMFLRLWASIGPDSFVLQRLLPPFGSAYSDISKPLNHGLNIALVLAFPVFVSATILALLVADQTVAVIIWPTMAYAVTSLFHNRTRYRQAWLPGAALLLVATVFTQGFWATLMSSESIVQWVACVGLALALIRFRVRSDFRRTS